MEQMTRLLLATIGLGAWLCVAACGSGDTPSSPASAGGGHSGSGGSAGAGGANSNGGSGGTNSNGGAGGGSGNTCQPAPGTYTATYTLLGNSPTCPPHAPATVTFPNNYSPINTSGIKCSSSCSGAVSSVTCSSSTTVGTSVVTFSATSTITYTTSGATGTVTENENVMGTPTTCAYSLVITKATTGDAGS
jgi:hypothetical protein